MIHTYTHPCTIKPKQTWTQINTHSHKFEEMTNAWEKMPRFFRRIEEVETPELGSNYNS